MARFAVTLLDGPMRFNRVTQEFEGEGEPKSIRVWHDGGEVVYLIRSLGAMGADGVQHRVLVGSVAMMPVDHMQRMLLSWYMQTDRGAVR